MEASVGGVKSSEYEHTFARNGFRNHDCNMRYIAAYLKTKQRNSIQNDENSQHQKGRRLTLTRICVSSPSEEAPLFSFDWLSEQNSQSVATQPSWMQKIDHCPVGTGGLFSSSQVTRWLLTADDRFAGVADDDLPRNAGDNFAKQTTT